MAGPTALVSFFDLLNQSFPYIGRQELRGLPLFRPFFFPLPVDHSGEKRDAVCGGGTIPIPLFRPLHRAAHRGGLEFAAGNRFAGETFGFFDPLFFCFCRPVIPRFAKGRVFASEVNGGHLLSRESLRN